MLKLDLPSAGTDKPLVLGLGVFDGVHRGHRKIISELVAMGRRCGALPVAVTFIPHPREVLSAPPLPRLLLPPEERFRRLREAGAEGVGIIDFSRETADTPPEEFLAELLKTVPPVHGICVGSRWRFGRGGNGDTAFLAVELAKRDIAFDAVPELRMNGEIVSSSAIREAVAAGDIAGASDMLGTFPGLYGEVERGLGIAGSQLHAPTANIRVDFGILPPDGVYAGRTELNGKIFAAAINIGFAPTFGGMPERRVECHIIGFSGELHHRKIAVELVAKLRGERKFASVGELAEQIRSDRERALEILSSNGALK